MKIVICGGHHNSALVVAEKLREEGDRIFWFGHKFSMIGDKNPSAEYQEVTAKNFPFIEITAGKWQPKHHFFRNLLRIPFGFWQSFINLWQIKPDLIVSFGGYLALPIVICGWVLGISSVTHEQTVVSGLANKIIARFCQKIFVSFSSSLGYFPKDKVVLTGLPIRKEIFEKGKKIFENSRKTIYVTGGKQGAHVINKAVFSILPQLLQKFNVIHQCGSTSLYHDMAKAELLKVELGEKGKYYLVKDYFFDHEIGSIFNSADFVISRAGGHTIYELLLLKKPAILVPIPWSTHGEQLENAKMLESCGLARILSQTNLGKGKLLEVVDDFSNNLPNGLALKNLPPVEKEAASKIVSEIKKLLNN